MKILLISGHGAGDPGACAIIDGKYYREADLTVEVVDNLAPLLRAYGATVDVYDKRRDAYQDYKAGTLASRARFGGYHYVLEIHFNACVKDYTGNGYTTGTEIYYPSRGKPSGAESAILRHVCAQGFRNRGSASMALAVINTAAGSGVKANLLEVCFIDDADDMRLYISKKQQIAQAIADGVAEAFGLTKTGAPTSVPANTTTKEVPKMDMLKKGSKGYQVKVAQLLLIGLGYSCGGAGADGDFGGATLAAVKRYQAVKGLDADGIVGPKTWACLLGC